MVVPFQRPFLPNQHGLAVFLGRLRGLRDTHASLLATAGVPLEVVSKRLGHSNIAITAERYLDVYSDRDVAAATAFERLVDKRSADLCDTIVTFVA